MEAPLQQFLKDLLRVRTADAVPLKIDEDPRSPADRTDGRRRQRGFEGARIALCAFPDVMGYRYLPMLDGERHPSRAFHGKCAMEDALKDFSRRGMHKISHAGAATVLNRRSNEPQIGLNSLEYVHFTKK
jgi:hypothetical protein